MHAGEKCQPGTGGNALCGGQLAPGGQSPSKIQSVNRVSAPIPCARCTNLLAAQRCASPFVLWQRRAAPRQAAAGTLLSLRKAATAAVAELRDCTWTVHFCWTIAVPQCQGLQQVDLQPAVAMMR